MEGGVLEAMGEGCYDIGCGSKNCPFSIIIRAGGKFYDICYEMAKILEVDYETQSHWLKVGL
jgi:hypothetical protein